MSDDSDSDSAAALNNGNGYSPTNDDVERRTWEWFHGAVALRFGPAHYFALDVPDGDRWPDVVALRAHNRVAFEITSPLRPGDVVRKKANSSEGEEDGLPVQVQFERRVMEALRRKIKKYARVDHASRLPLGLLITLAHPSAQRFSSPHTDLRRLANQVNGHLSNFLHQPLDAVYLVGPGEKAVLLWRRRGPQWRKIFPELGGVSNSRNLENKLSN